MNTLKNAIKGLIGDKLLGVLDYYRFPEQRVSWGGAFNGQAHRQRIFLEIVSRCRPIAIVETGTFKGTTTMFMAKESQLPVYSVEQNGRIFGFARRNLRSLQNVHLYHEDSRRFLREILDSARLNSEPIFFYLDAHWGTDLPLAEEITMIFAANPEAIVMIDDFQVPGDDGYSYDDYGEGKRLNREYIEPAMLNFALGAFYPSKPSAEETGARRGCVVVAGRRMSEVLRELTSLSGSA